MTFIQRVGCLEKMIERAGIIYGTSVFSKEPYSLKTIVPFFIHHVFFEDTKMFTITNLRKKEISKIVNFLNKAYHIGTIETAYYMNSVSSKEELEELPVVED